jgi:hypothetical protein
VLLEEWIRWGLDDNWHWIDASRVSLMNSSHQLQERMTGQLEHWRWSFYSWRPSGLALGLAMRLWHRLKPWLKKWRDWREAALVVPVTTPTPAPADKGPAPIEKTKEGEHASPSHSQR